MFVIEGQSDKYILLQWQNEIFYSVFLIAVLYWLMKC